jgi:hypothetical protein
LFRTEYEYHVRAGHCMVGNSHPQQEELLVGAQSLQAGAPAKEI